MAAVGGTSGSAKDPDLLGYWKFDETSGTTARRSMHRIQITIMAWAQYRGRADADEFNWIMTRRIGATSAEMFGVGLFFGKPAMVLNQAFLTEGGPLVPTGNQWLHLAGTYDGSKQRVYLNGVEVTSIDAARGFPPENNPLIIGGSQNLGEMEEYWHGQLDEVRLYKRALTAAEIKKVAGLP